MLTKQQIVPTLIENRNYFANHEVYYGLSREQIKELRENVYEIREFYFTRMMEERDRYEREEKSTGWNVLGVSLYQIDDYLEKTRPCAVICEQPKSITRYCFSVFFAICLGLLLWCIISFSS
jgi:hypothetical protein